MATPPKQARSIATEQKMLDAAEELLQGGDSRQVTVENVTKLSGTKVSSFYARFGSVEGLFDALRDRYRNVKYQTAILESHEKALQQTDLRSALHHSLKPTLELARREHVAISYLLRNPIVDQVELINQRKFMVDKTLEILQKHRKEIKKKDLRRASENISRMAHATWVHLALMDPSEFIGRKTSLSSVIELTTDMAHAYLTAE
jgi:AcrR family transcriptional regulator